MHGYRAYPKRTGAARAALASCKTREPNACGLLRHAPLKANQAAAMYLKDDAAAMTRAVQLRRWRKALGHLRLQRTTAACSRRFLALYCTVFLTLLKNIRNDYI